MLPQRERLPSVTAAGIVAAIFACFGILGCGLVLLLLLVAPHLPKDSGPPAMPEGLRALVGAMYVFFLAVCVGELVVAINVFRRRNWARILMLVWAGFMVAVCAFGMIGIFLIGDVLSKTQPQVPDQGAFLLFVRLFTFVIYGIPLAVGIWWLILFTRPRVAAAFQNSDAAPLPMSLDPSGFPSPQFEPLPPAAKKPSVPLPIAVIAALDISGAAWMILMCFIPLPFQAPFFLFGVQIPQVPYKIFLALLGVSYIAFVVGIFKLRRWGLDSLLFVKGLFVLSGIVTLFNPRFMASMNQTMLQVTAKYPALPTGQPIFPPHMTQTILAISYVFAVALLVVMLVYRGRFLQAAAAKATS